MFKSIRFKITLYYIIVLLLVLSLFSFFLYNKIKNVLKEHTDNLLFIKAETISDTIENLIKNYPDINPKCNDYILCNKDTQSLISSIINAHSQEADTANIAIRILNKEGKDIIFSQNVPFLLPLSRERIKEVLSDKAVYETILIEDEKNKISTEYRNYFTTIDVNNRVLYIVWAIKPLSQTHFILNAMLGNILVFIPLTIFLTALWPLHMVSLAFKPINEIIKTIKQITEKNLHLRVALPANKDEIWEVANLFNEMLKRLEESFNSQKNFIQDVSHQLKTPLTILKGEMEIALKKQRSADEYLKIIESNLEEINRMIRLIEELLFVAKIENRQENSKVDMDVNEVVKSVCERMKKLANNKGIKINLSTLKERCVIKKDLSLFSIALSNIIENAIKYSPENSQVDIALSKSENRLLIEVKDYGPGISGEELPRIFEKFYRAKNSQGKEGFGLGLAIAKKSIEVLNGQIEVRSEIGRGTIFTISFDLN